MQGSGKRRANAWSQHLEPGRCALEQPCVTHLRVKADGLRVHDGHHKPINVPLHRRLAQETGARKPHVSLGLPHVRLGALTCAPPARCLRIAPLVQLPGIAPLLVRKSPPALRLRLRLRLAPWHPAPAPITIFAATFPSHAAVTCSLLLPASGSGRQQAAAAAAAGSGRRGRPHSLLRQKQKAKDDARRRAAGAADRSCWLWRWPRPRPLVRAGFGSIR
jgi:hypothetical protein